MTPSESTYFGCVIRWPLK